MALVATFGLFGFALVMFLARGRRTEGVATPVDAVWSDFCEARGLWIAPASGLLGEDWPTISGSIDGVGIEIDVRDDRYAGRAPATRFVARAVAVSRGALRVESNDGERITTTSVVRTGDAEFDGEMSVVAETAAIARLLDDVVRRALLAVASRHSFRLEVDAGRITLAVSGVLARVDDLDVALRAVIACARARDSAGYR